MFNQVFNKRRVLITGHNGFKGSWLAQWLSLLGAEVHGLSVNPPTNPNHWSHLNLKIESEHNIDISIFDDLEKALLEIKPEIIFHLAAQSLVKEGFRSPLKTWRTNLMGTANLIECSYKLDSLKAIVVVTTDKCYENQEWLYGYREIDKLGGKDPYSASKASCELLVESYRNNFLKSKKIKIATARAGNVIGGGDWSEERLIPDLIKSILNNNDLVLRAPNSTRPWQHVLDCLSGYLLLAENLFLKGEEYAKAWNYGPNHASNKPVAELVYEFKKHIPKLSWHISQKKNLGESVQLHLDSTLARNLQNWESVWNFNKTVQKTAEWYQSWIKSHKVNTIDDIIEYQNDATNKNIIWTRNNK